MKKMKELRRRNSMAVELWKLWFFMRENKAQNPAFYASEMRRIEKKQKKNDKKIQRLLCM